MWLSFRVAIVWATAEKIVPKKIMAAATVAQAAAARIAIVARERSMVHCRSSLDAPSNTLR
jgi:hypothetical protein